MSDTFSIILGAALVVAAIAISVFLYLISRQPRTAPLSEQGRAEQEARRQLDEAQGAKIRHTGRGAGL
ncbi:hypothetical protein K2F54_15940 [Cryobacterium sp. 1639]|uniref:hypothetical protein n=1 Tax=Cryobacterium inferilacus TaxID=2866629 RepID=UPI001C73A69E|nr:hypothetical protein [Cryobacterium sp. 1639]MBX0301465.1 hypothetical protein [Cryobacterium sp. 1639]